MNEENAPTPPGHIDEFEFEHMVREKAYQLWEAAGSPPNSSMILEAQRSQDGAISPSACAGSADQSGF
jgi:hypothetical protein